MTISSEIQKRLIEQVIKDATTITDPVELVAAAKEKGYWWAQVSAFTGADEWRTREKFRVGVKGKEDTSPEQYALYSKPVTAENYPGNAYSYDDAIRRFDEVIIAEMDVVLEKLRDMHWISDIYREQENRAPDFAGFAFWIGVLADGHAEADVRGWILSGFQNAEAQE